MGLTRKQYEALTFVSNRTRESGISPSFDEIADAIDIKSKSGVHRIMTALEDRGYIRRMHRCARAIEVLRLPANSNESRAPISREQMRKGQLPGHRSPISRGDTVSVPLVGRISNSTPIEALQNKVGDISVESGMLGRGAHYALEVVGDSMIGAGIIDGDNVVIQESDKAQSGEIVVVLVDNSIAMLRRLRWRGDIISLELANMAYETRLYTRDRVAIQGRVVGLIRRY